MFARTQFFERVMRDESSSSSASLPNGGVSGVISAKKTAEQHQTNHQRQQQISDDSQPHSGEFVGPEFEEDAYFSHVAATPSFDDFDAEVSDPDDVLVHWHQDSAEEIEAVDFREEDSIRTNNHKKINRTRRDFNLVKEKIRDKSKQFMDFVKGERFFAKYLLENESSILDSKNTKQK